MFNKIDEGTSGAISDYLAKKMAMPDEKLAIRITDVTKSSPKHRYLSQILYKMDPPYLGYIYIVASAANLAVGFFATTETYLFPADAEGKFSVDVELEGSQRETLSHEKIMSDIGYQIV